MDKFLNFVLLLLGFTIGLLVNMIGLIYNFCYQDCIKKVSADIKGHNMKMGQQKNE